MEDIYKPYQEMFNHWSNTDGVKVSADELLRIVPILALLVIQVIFYLLERMQNKRLDNKLRTQEEDIEKSKQKQQSEIKKLQEKGEKLRNMINGLTSDLNEQQKNLTAYIEDTTQKTLNGEVLLRERLAEYLTEQNSKIEAIEEKSEQLKKDLVKVQEIGHEERTKEVQRLEQLVKEHAMGVDALKPKLSEIDSCIAKNKTAIKEESTKVGALMTSQRDELTALKTDITNVQRIAKEAAAKMQTLETRMIDDKLDVTEACQKASNTLKSDIHDLKRDNKELITKVQVLEKSYADHQEDLDKLQNESTIIKTNVLDIQRDSKDEKAKAHHQQEIVSNLGTDVQRLETMSKDLQTGQEVLENKTEEQKSQTQGLKTETKDIELKLYKQHDQMEKDAKENKKTIQKLQDNIEFVETSLKTYVNQETFQKSVNSLEHSSKVHSRNIRQSINAVGSLVKGNFEDLFIGLKDVQGFHPTNAAMNRVDEESDWMHLKFFDEASHLLSRGDYKGSKVKLRRPRNPDELRMTSSDSPSDLDSVRGQPPIRYVPYVYTHSGDETGLIEEMHDGRNSAKQVQFETRRPDDDEEEDGST